MGFFGGWAGKEQCFPLIFTGFGFRCGVVSLCIGQCYGFAENRILNRVGGKQLSMKQKFLGVLALLALAVSCGKKEIPANENTASRAAQGSRGTETQAPTALTFDQSFIDMVYHATNSLGAGQYLTERLGKGGAYEFIQSVGAATDLAAYDAAFASFQVSQSTVEEFTLMALGSSAVFSYLHPEMAAMPAEEQALLLRQSFESGMYSGDPRWERIRLNLESRLQYFVNPELYKADPGWQAVVGCVVETLGPLIGTGFTALQLGKQISEGKMLASARSIRGFLRTTTGRIAVLVAALYMAWEIYDCISSLPQQGGQTSVRPGAATPGNEPNVNVYLFPYI